MHCSAAVSNVGLYWVRNAFYRLDEETMQEGDTMSIASNQVQQTNVSWDPERHYLISFNMDPTPFQPSAYNIRHFRYFFAGPGHFEIRAPQTISNSVIEVIVHQQKREEKEHMWSGIWGWCWHWMGMFIYEKVKQWDMITPLFGFRYSMLECLF